MTVFEQAGAVSGILALLGILLVVPLYLSQLRDLRRLRRWRELAPQEGDPDPYPQPAAPAAETVTTYRSSEAARRVTGERPALPRSTQEFRALGLDPSDTTLASRIPQPRHPLAIAGVVVLAALALSAAALTLLRVSAGDDAEMAANEPFDRGSITVAILNGSTESGLSGRVAQDVEALGFKTGEIGVTFELKKRSAVLYTAGNKPPALVLANEANVDGKVKPVDAATRAEAGGADLVFVVGDDRLGEKRKSK